MVEEGEEAATCAYDCILVEGVVGCVACWLLLVFLEVEESLVCAADKELSLLLLSVVAVRCLLKSVPEGRSLRFLKLLMRMSARIFLRPSRYSISQSYVDNSCKYLMWRGE